MKVAQTNGEIHFVFEKDDVARIAEYQDLLVKKAIELCQADAEEKLDARAFYAFAETISPSDQGFTPSPEQVDLLVKVLTNSLDGDSGLRKLTPFDIAFDVVMTHALGMGAHVAFTAEQDAAARAEWKARSEDDEGPDPYFDALVEAAASEAVAS